jgi:hypothetical protein
VIGVRIVYALAVLNLLFLAGDVLFNVLGHVRVPLAGWVE